MRVTCESEAQPEGTTITGEDVGGVLVRRFEPRFWYRLARPNYDVDWKFPQDVKYYLIVDPATGKSRERVLDIDSLTYRLHGDLGPVIFDTCAMPDSNEVRLYTYIKTAQTQEWAEVWATTAEQMAQACAALCGFAPTLQFWQESQLPFTSWGAPIDAEHDDADLLHNVWEQTNAALDNVLADALRSGRGSVAQLHNVQVSMHKAKAELDVLRAIGTWFVTSAALSI